MHGGRKYFSDPQKSRWQCPFSSRSCSAHNAPQPPPIPFSECPPPTPPACPPTGGPLHTHTSSEKGFKWRLQRTCWKRSSRKSPHSSDDQLDTKECKRKHVQDARKEIRKRFHLQSFRHRHPPPPYPTPRVESMIEFQKLIHTCCAARLRVLAGHMLSSKLNIWQCIQSAEWEVTQ